MMYWKGEMRSTALIGILVLLATLFGCGGGDPLDYETAMNLLRERATDPIRTSFSASPRFDTQDEKVSQAYQRLIDSHVIQCKTGATMGTICEPGPAGDALTQNGATDLTLVAGRWAPSAIVSLRRSGRASAQADVRMIFEPSEVFREFEDAFDQIQMPSATLSARKQGKMARVVFQRYEDGWHVESIQ
jgi:hypothetical protein